MGEISQSATFLNVQQNHFRYAFNPFSIGFWNVVYFRRNPAIRFEIKVSAAIETENPPRAGQLNNTFLHYFIL